MRKLFGRILARLYGYRLITLGPHDVLVYSREGYLSELQRETVATQLRQIFGQRTKVVVLNAGARLDVVRMTPAMAAIAEGRAWPPVRTAPPMPPPPHPEFPPMSQDPGVEIKEFGRRRR